MAQVLQYQQEEKEKEVVLQGITRKDIEEIFSRAFAEYNVKGNIIFHFDVSYLMNWHLSDFEYIKKLTWLTRFDAGLMKEWHRLCERWFNDQTVLDYRNQPIEPIGILRKADRVPNEGMEQIAADIIGKGTHVFQWDCVGKGVGSVYPADNILIDEVDRINIPVESIGGSVNRDGSTVYWVANYPKAMQDADCTEGGIVSTLSQGTDRMMNHTVFDGYIIPHRQGIDVVSRTTVLYQCAAG